MDRIDENIMLAAGLLPTIDKLYAAGITSIGASHPGEIHVANELFHNVFRTWYVVDNRKDEWVYHYHNLAGAKFFCLVKREEAEADG